MPNPPEADVAAVCERLRADGVDVVRVSYPDLIGVDRGRDVLLDELPAAVGHGLAFCRAVYHTSPMGDVVPVEGGLEAGLPDIHVVPDLSSLTALPWEPNAAWCIGEAFTPDGAAAPEAPRTVVRRVAERLSALGYELACGPELEFYLCQQAPDGRWRRYADDPGNVYVVGRKGDPQGLLLHMLRQLRDAGLQVTAANHEFSPGQFEINLAHSPLVYAADRSFRLKSAVQEIARHEGMLATFMAKPFNGISGCSMHLHVSLWKDGEPAFAPENGSENPLMRSALGGLLQHLDGIALYGSPTVNSYKRFELDSFAPVNVSWGGDNRTVSIRSLIESPGATRIELRTPAADANPYWAAAALLTAIATGIEDGADPGTRGEGYLYGVGEELPQTLGDAIRAARADERIVELLGRQAVEDLLLLSSKEWRAFTTQVSAWDIERYQGAI